MTECAIYSLHLSLVLGNGLSQSVRGCYTTHCVPPTTLLHPAQCPTHQSAPPSTGPHPSQCPTHYYVPPTTSSHAPHCPTHRSVSPTAVSYSPHCPTQHHVLFTQVSHTNSSHPTHFKIHCIPPIMPHPSTLRGVSTCASSLALAPALVSAS